MLIRTGKDFLVVITQIANKSKLDTTFSEIDKMQLGKNQFYRLSGTVLEEGASYYAYYLSRIHNDYLINLSMTARSATDLKALVKVADSMRLFSVPQEIDNSNGGKLFRKKMSIASP